MAEKITGIKAPRIHLSPTPLKAMAGFMKLVEAVLSIPEIYSAESLRGIAGVTSLASNEKAKRELGYRVRPLEEGLRETLLHEMQLLGMKPKMPREKQ
jgi:nucleoside-diphosphate-sugar epimerase